jgi:hypothetical protein
MWRALKIIWRIVWGTVELAIVLYVLNAITDRNTGLIVGVLGLIYATMRSLFLTLSLSLGMALMHMGTTLDREIYELKYIVRTLWQEEHRDVELTELERPDTADAETARTRAYVDASIASVFIALLYLICLLQVFSKL